VRAARARNDLREERRDSILISIEKSRGIAAPVAVLPGRAAPAMNRGFRNISQLIR
jgi:hypothetical protein